MSEVERVSVAGLKVAKVLYDFVVHEVIPDTGVEAGVVLAGLDDIISRFAPLNRKLLQRRDELQAKIDDWYRERRGRDMDEAADKAFLQEIGYLVPEGPAFKIDTANVDDEIAAVAGPQLVVPISNARYALNAANARWGSLYDALYGSDAIPATTARPQGKGYDPERGKRVIAWARHFLDQARAACLRLACRCDRLCDQAPARSQPRSTTARRSGSPDPKQFRGYRGRADAPEAVLAGQQRPAHRDGRSIARIRSAATDAAGVADVVLEAALTTIMDLEDSIAAVDPARQGGGLSQLARSVPGNAGRDLSKGRQDPLPGGSPRTAPIPSPTAARWCCRAAA